MDLAAERRRQKNFEHENTPNERLVGGNRNVSRTRQRVFYLSAGGDDP